MKPETSFIIGSVVFALFLVYDFLFVAPFCVAGANASVLGSCYGPYGEVPLILLAFVILLLAWFTDFEEGKE